MDSSQLFRDQIVQEVIAEVKSHVDTNSKLRNEFDRLISTVSQHQVKFTEIDTLLTNAVSVDKFDCERPH